VLKGPAFLYSLMPVERQNRPTFGNNRTSWNYKQPKGHSPASRHK